MDQNRFFEHVIYQHLEGDRNKGITCQIQRETPINLKAQSFLPI